MFINNLKKLTFFISVCILSSCIHTVKTDMNNYIQNKEEYKWKRVVFTTDLNDILERYDTFKGKEVELTAPVGYFGKDDFPTFYLLLEEEGRQLRAYEENYHRYVNGDALQLLILANREGGKVTVRGKLKEDGIELKQLVYNEYLVNTNKPPYRYRPTRRSPYRDYSGYYDSFTRWNFSNSYNY